MALKLRAYLLGRLSAHYGNSMATRYRPHVLGIDDGPFVKHVTEKALIVGVMMEGADLIEAVAVSRFPVDGAEVTAFLGSWIEGLRFRPALQCVLLGGITIAGLCVVDVEQLSATLRLPVVVTNRKLPTNALLVRALESANLQARIPIVDRSPAPFAVSEGLFAAQAGADREWAARLLRVTRLKSELPEPLRLAHMIARGIATGESRGRP